MKEKYTKPVVQTEEFTTVDVVTTSGNPDSGNIGNLPGEDD